MFQIFRFHSDISHHMTFMLNFFLFVRWITVRVLIASKGVCKMHSAQYFVSFWTHIHSKLILQFMFFFFLFYCTMQELHCWFQSCTWGMRVTLTFRVRQCCGTTRSDYGVKYQYKSSNINIFIFIINFLQRVFTLGIFCLLFQ